MSERRYTNKARKEAARFIEDVVSKVETLLADPKNGFYFAKFFNRTDQCKRCMAGWLPVLYPGQVMQDGENIRARNRINSVFHPSHIGVPISRKVWTALTVHLTQEAIGEPTLPRQAQFETVKNLWLNVARRYRAGELDHELIQESELLDLSHLSN